MRGDARAVLRWRMMGIQAHTRSTSKRRSSRDNGQGKARQGKARHQNESE